MERILNRTCGECTLCCKLLPVRELGKKASTRCKYQRSTGCQIYAKRPGSCVKWSCSWLTDPATAHLRRPDRAHYVIDPQPDFIRLEHEDGTIENLPVLQIWVDSAYPDVHKDPDLMELLNHNRIVGLVRYDSHRAFAMFPPSVCQNQRWNYKRSNIVSELEHSIRQVHEFLEEYAEPSDLPQVAK